MQAIITKIPEVVILKADVHNDERGFFYESFNKKVFAQLTNVDCEFVQDNHAFSKKHVVRGLHYQIKQTQAKLVRVMRGEVFSVAVDIRRSSKFFGKWVGEVLNAQNKKQMWIPKGFAHGYAVISDEAQFLYKTTDYYAPEFERTILWSDPSLNINWQINQPPTLSSKDLAGKLLFDAEVFE